MPLLCILGFLCHKRGSGSVVCHKRGSGSVVCHKRGSGSVVCHKRGSGSVVCHKGGSGSVVCHKRGSGSVVCHKRGSGHMDTKEAVLTIYGTSMAGQYDVCSISRGSTWENMLCVVLYISGCTSTYLYRY